MDTTARSPRPESFHVSARSSEVTDLFTGSRDAARAEARDEPAAGSRRPRPASRLPGLMDSARMWWDDWLPVAATGWGAVFLIAPLLAAHVLIRAVGGQRSPES